MSHLKKILVLTLVATMVLGLAGSGLAAAPKVITTAFSDAEGHEFEEALAFLAGLGVYKGDKGIGGPARPDDPITRAEFAAVVVRAMGKEKTAQAMANYVPDFADAAQIPSWAWGYVKVASTLGLVKGFEDGTFRANDQVTQAQALAMLVRAIGHEPLVKGVWPGNYVTYGYDVGIAGDLEIFANMPATRGEVAQMVENAMETIIYNAVAEEYADADNTTGTEGEIDDVEEEMDFKASLRAGGLRSGWQLWAGKVESVDEDDATISIVLEGETEPEEIDLAGQVVLSGVSRLSDLVNYDVEAVGKSDEILFIKVTEEADVVGGVLEEEEDFDVKKVTTAKEDFDGEITLDGDEEYDFDENTEFYVNGEKVSSDVRDKVTGTGAEAAVLEAWLGQAFGDIDSDVTVEVAMDKEDNVAVSLKAVYYDVFDAVAADDPEEDDDEDDEIVAKIKVDLDEFDSPDVDKTINIMKDTVITINGEAASWDDLKADMCLDIATKGAAFAKDSAEEEYEAYRIAATDETLVGEFKSLKWVTTSTGGYWKLTLEIDDADKSYKLSGKYSNSQGDESELKKDLRGTVKVGMNSDGKVRIAIETEAEQDYALLTGVVSDGNDVESFELDRRGDGEVVDLVDADTADTATGMQLMVAFDDNEDAIEATVTTVPGWVYFDTAAGAGVEKPVKIGETLISVEMTNPDGDIEEIAIANPDDGWTVDKIYADDKIVVIEKGGKKVYVENPAVYDDEWDYIGVEGLDADDEVVAYEIPDGTVIGLMRK